MGKKARRRKKKQQSKNLLDGLPTYDPCQADKYSVHQLEEMVGKIPTLVKTVQDEITSRKNEMLLYENEEGAEKEQLKVAKVMLELYSDQQQLFMMMGHITVDQCKRYKRMALEKERLLEEWKRAHGKISSSTEKDKV